MTRDRSAIRRPRRAAQFLASAVVLGCGTLVAACRDMITDDVVDAEAALCDTISACGVEGDSCDRLQRFFEKNGEDEWDEYLAHYIEWSCGGGCGSIGVCLDFPPICADAAEPCQTGIDCCYGSTGARSCADSGTCCSAAGVPCETTADCCPLAVGGDPVECFARDGSSERTCGGAKPCAFGDVACSEDTPCCGTAQCDEGSCVAVTCVATGESCRGGDTCCEGEDRCEGGVCTPPDKCIQNPKDPECCASETEGCVDSSTCCGALECRVDPATGAGQCIDPVSCGPINIECETDEDCCQNDKEIHCLGPGLVTSGSEPRSCKEISCQLDEGETCTDSFRCCAGLVCTSNVEGESTCEKACEPGSCHPIRVFGPPIDLTQADCLEEGEAECVQQICAEDDFCCCVEWDESCIDQATACMADRNDG